MLAALTITMVVHTPVLAQSGMANPMGGGGSKMPNEPKPLKRVPYIGPANQTLLVDVRLQGLSRVPEERVRTMLQTRKDRIYDPEQVQRDVRALIKSRLFRDVNTYKQPVEGGLIITFELFERPVMQYVRFIGNEKIKDKALGKQVGFRAGDPLNRFDVEEGRRRLEGLYANKGFQNTFIEIREGANPEDKGVVYEINEGQITRILSASFEGNSIASDSRLRTQIKSKPGIGWVIGGKLDDDLVEQDLDRLTAYYRNLGFFRARVGREVSLTDSGKWAKVKFVIDEGPRYRVRSMEINGNNAFETNQLLAKLETRAGEFVSLNRMQRDLTILRDEYGSLGFIFADIKAQPRFDEEPGNLDIVYNINEGQQYRVGRIIVNIDGQQAGTRRNVVLNRLSIAPGDLVDVREIRKSERRLMASQLFETNPTQGDPPKIVVKPPVGDDELAHGPGLTARGQSPPPLGRLGTGFTPFNESRPDRHVVQRPIVDLAVTVTSKEAEGDDVE